MLHTANTAPVPQAYHVCLSPRPVLVPVGGLTCCHSALRCGGSWPVTSHPLRGQLLSQCLGTAKEQALPNELGQEAVPLMRLSPALTLAPDAPMAQPSLPTLRRANRRRGGILRLGRGGRGPVSLSSPGFPAAVFPLPPKAWTAQPVTLPGHSWNPFPALTRFRVAFRLPSGLVQPQGRQGGSDPGKCHLPQTLQPPGLRAAPAPWPAALPILLAAV